MSLIVVTPVLKEFYEIIKGIVEYMSSRRCHCNDGGREQNVHGPKKRKAQSATRKYSVSACLYTDLPACPVGRSASSHRCGIPTYKMLRTGQKDF